MHIIHDGLNADKRRVFTCSNGVQLALRPVPSLAIVAIQKTLKEPQPPIIIDTERGGREFANEADPTYIRELSDYRAALGEATTTAYLANGVTVLEPLPDDILPLESSDWVEGLEYAGIQVPEKGIGRRVAWLKYHVIQDEDLGNLIGAIATAGGLVTEEDVAAVANNFRDNTTGDTNSSNQNSTES